MDEEKEREELDYISDGSLVSLYSLSIKRIIELLNSYIITLFGGAAVYGLVSVLIRVESFLVTLTVGGFRTGILRTLPRKTTEEKNSIITFMIPVFLIIWLITSSSIILGGDFIIENTLLKEKHYSVLYIFSLSLLFLFPIPIVSSIFKSHRQVRLSQFIWTILKPFIFLFGPVISILLVSDKLYPIWLFVTLLSFFLFVFSFYLLLTRTEYSFVNPLKNKSSLKEFFDYSKNTIGSAFFGTIQYRGVFILMTIFLSPINAGLLSLSYIISDAVRWPLTSVNKIIPPVMTEVHNEGNKKILESLYERTSLIINYVSIPVFIIIILFHSEMLTFFSQKYESSTIVLPILAAGQLISISSGSVGLMLNMVDKQKEAMWLQIFITIFFFPVVIYLGFKYGLIGLAAGSTGILIVNNVLELILLKYSYNISPFTIRHIKLYVAGFSLLITGFILNNLLNGIILLICFLILTFIFYKFCYSYVLEKNDIYLIKKSYENINVFKE